MSNMYSGPSIDAFYQVSVHLARRFQRRRFFRNQPIRNKNCLWRPCLLMDRDKMSNLHRGPSINASYQVSVHLAEKLTDNIRRTPSDGKSLRLFLFDRKVKVCDLFIESITINKTLLQIGYCKESKKLSVNF